MSDAHRTDRDNALALGHLSELTLEQLAEGELSPDESRFASEHLATCTHCAGELEAHRALFSALASLPRFAPSTAFSDAVIARTRLTPEPGPVALWLRQFVPKTRRGWALLGTAVVAPALPVIAAAFWLLTHPLLTPLALWQWVTLQGRAVTGPANEMVTQLATESGVGGVVRGATVMAGGVPMVAVTVSIAFLAIAIPLSVWAIVRLARSPMRDATYAN